MRFFFAFSKKNWIQTRKKVVKTFAILLCGRRGCEISQQKNFLFYLCPNFYGKLYFLSFCRYYINVDGFPGKKWIVKWKILLFLNGGVFYPCATFYFVFFLCGKMNSGQIFNSFLYPFLFSLSFLNFLSCRCFIFNDWPRKCWILICFWEVFSDSNELNTFQMEINYPPVKISKIQFFLRHHFRANLEAHN